MQNHRLVYSTETGRICTRCGKAAVQCRCKKRKETSRDRQPSGYPQDGTVRIRREVKGRRGKTVTAVFGLSLEGRALKRFARDLKQACGSGGTVKDGIVVIQGDHRDTLRTVIAKRGYTVKIAGG